MEAALPERRVGPVLPQCEGRPADYYNFGSRVFAPALRRAGLRKIRIHDLRHGAASMLIACGLDVTTVARQLGHADAGVTLGVYSHWFARRTESGVAAKLSSFLAEEEKADGCALVVGGAEESRKSA